MAIEGKADSGDSTRLIIWKMYSERPEKQKKVAEKRVRVLCRILDLESAGTKRTQAVDLVSKEAGISSSTIYNWFELIKGSDRQDWLPALLGKWKGFQGEGAKYSLEAWKYFTDLYLTPEARTAEHCYTKLNEASEGRGWIFPSLKSLMRRLYREYSEKEITTARGGRKARSRMHLDQERDKTCLHALQCVDCDGHKFDVFTRWKNGAIIRPIGFFFHDVFSGKLLSHRVDVTENKDLVRLAFADLVQTYGIPNDIVADNSRAVWSKWLSGGTPTRYRFKVQEDEVEGIFVKLGCQLHPTIPYSGQSKPVERAFRDLAERVSKHPAFTGAYCGNKPDAKPENYASKAVPIDLFLKILAQEVKSHNAREGRRSPVCRGRSFDAVFAESLSRVQVRRATRDQWALLLMAAENIRSDRDDGSIKFMGNRFHTEKLAKHRGESLIVRFDPQALKKGILVYDRQNSFICAAECIEPVGFLNTQVAREHMKRRRQSEKADKIKLENERWWSGVQLAQMLPEGAAQENPSPKIIEGFFGKKFQVKRKEKEMVDRNFTEAVGEMSDDELREIAANRG